MGRVSTAVVQRFCKPKVGGSIPSPGTTLFNGLDRRPIVYRIEPVRRGVSADSFGAVSILAGATNERLSDYRNAPPAAPNG